MESRPEGRWKAKRGRLQTSQPAENGGVWSSQGPKIFWELQYYVFNFKDAIILTSFNEATPSTWTWGKACYTQVWNVEEEDPGCDLCRVHKCGEAMIWAHQLKQARKVKKGQETWRCLSPQFPKTFGRTESLTAHRTKDLNQISKDRLTQSDSLDIERVFSHQENRRLKLRCSKFGILCNNSKIKDTK